MPSSSDAPKNNDNNRSTATAAATATTTTTTTMDVPTSDVIRLVQAYLTEQGMHQSVRCLQAESGGVGMAGLPSSARNNLRFYAASGQWNSVLESLALVDRRRNSSSLLSEDLVAAVHEMAVLEVADAGDLQLAYSMYKLVQKRRMFDACPATSDDDGSDGDDESEGEEEEEGGAKKKKSASSNNDHNNKMSRARLLEQKLAALAAARAKDPDCVVPVDFYGSSSGGGGNGTLTKKKKNKPSDSSDSAEAAAGAGIVAKRRQLRRDRLGRRLQRAVPEQPANRLPQLLQQAVKWQCYTGQIPQIKQLWENEREDAHDTDESDDDDGDGKKRKKKKQKSKEKKKRQKVFDLVLGEVRVDPVTVGDTDGGAAALGNEDAPTEPIPSRPWSTVKFGKRATCESALFSNDGSSLITGSSDGFIELWSSQEKYAKLDLVNYKYQAEDEFMCHEGSGTTGTVSVTALAMTADTTMLASGDSNGRIKVWNLQTGKSLRTLTAYGGGDGGGSSAGGTGSTGDGSIAAAISCLNFSPDGTHLLVSGGSGGSTDGSVREFGLRTSRMLKEFRGHHTSYVSYCDYYLMRTSQQSQSTTLVVITASGDGTVRLWDTKSLDPIRVFRPVSTGPATHLSRVGSSLLASSRSADASSSEAGPAPAVVALLKLHTPPDTMVVVPRASRTYLVDNSGTVLRVFEDNSATSIVASSSATTTATKTGPSAAVFVAATVSATNRWLFAVKDDGNCCVFDVKNGNLERTIRNFGSESTSSSSSSEGGGPAFEITSVIGHPNKSIVAAFSNSKGQKRGTLKLWK